MKSLQVEIRTRVTTPGDARMEKVSILGTWKSGEVYDGEWQDGAKVGKSATASGKALTVKVT